jgi:hypothetical protein
MGSLPLTTAVFPYLGIVTTVHPDGSLVFMLQSRSKC